MRPLGAAAAFLVLSIVTPPYAAAATEPQPAAASGLPTVIEGGPAPEQPAQPDPPARIGRLGRAEGAVQYRPAADAAWAEGVPNMPLTTGNAVTTGQGRALLDLPDGRAALEAGSRLDVQRLDDQAVALALAEGQMALDLRALAQSESVQVVTPRGTVAIGGPGRYLVAAGTADSPTQVSVFAGAARVVAGGVDQPLAAGQALALSGPWPPRAELGRAGEPPPVMGWMAGFEPRGRLPAVVQGMVGADETLRTGRWETHPDLGAVWYPPVDADWAPYRQGRWVWVDPWGWTWVDDAYWGFAPFHYGRWVRTEAGWGWVPQPYAGPNPGPVRPAYAPALVNFWGGFSWGFGHGWGRPVAWAPLAPGEWYRPWYRHSRRYVIVLNRSGVRGATDLNGIPGQPPLPNQLTNRAGATAAPANAFASGAPIGRMGQPFHPAMLTGAQAFTGQPVAPAFYTPGLSAGAARQFGVAVPVGRPSIPPMRSVAVAAAGMPRVVGPGGVAPGRVPAYGGGLPSLGGGVPVFNGSGVPPMRGTAVPPLGGSAVPQMGGRAVPPMGGNAAPPMRGTAVPQLGRTAVPAFGNAYRGAAPPPSRGGPPLHASAPAARASSGGGHSGGGHSGGGGRHR